MSAGRGGGLYFSSGAETATKQKKIKKGGLGG